MGGNAVLARVPIGRLAVARMAGGRVPGGNMRVPMQQRGMQMKAGRNAGGGGR